MSDFEIDGKVNIDYSAFDKMSVKGAQAYEKLKKPFDRMTSDFAIFEDKLESIAKKSQAPFSTLHPAFVQATLDAKNLGDKYDSLTKKNRALYDIASKTAGVLGGKNYNNLSTQIDTALSKDFRPTKPIGGFGGGVEIGLSSREKNLAIVASMTARAAAEDEKFAKAEKDLADRMRFTTTEFDRAQKERQQFMQTSYRQQVMSAFGTMPSPEAQAARTATNWAGSIFKIKNLADAFAGSDEQLLKFVNHLPRVRYALYDVAASLSGTAIAFTALGVAPLAFGISANRSFADVQRTSKVADDGVNQLRQQFLELQQSIPESFGELTKIGSLAGQLNVATESLASFTKTVAMFSATTNVNVQDAATAFGRLDQLINGINGRYENLGSSILKVGVNSVATESQIIAIAQQIASIANLSKFSADQVIGLSGALASVGTSPELSRGLVTRLFGNIQSAIASGSEALKKFGAVSGQSGEEFKKAWETGAAAQLIKFLQGLNEDGTKAEATLRGLGIASIRDIPSILKLAQNWRDVAESLRLARDGFSDNTELQKQYGVIARTVADRIKLLTNNFEALMSTLSMSSTSAEGPIAFLVDKLSEFLQFLTNVANNPVSQFFVTFGIGASILVGVLATVGASIAFVAARGTALAQSLYDTAFSAGIFTTEINLANLSLRQFIATTTQAIVGTKIFQSALKSTLILGAIIVGYALLTTAIDNISNAMKSGGEKAKEYFNNIDVSQAIKADTEALRAGGTAYKTWSIAQEDSTNSISARKMALVGMTESEKALQAELDKTTSYVKEQTAAIGENYAQVLAQEFGSKVINEKDNPLRKIFDDPKLFEAFKKTGLNALDVVTTTIKDGLPAAQAKINEAFAQLQLDESVTNPTSQSRGRTGAGGYAGRDTKVISEGQTAFNDLAVAVANLTKEQQANIAYEEALGLAIKDAASDAEIATEKLKEYKDAVESAFSDTNTVSDFADSFQKLAEGIAQGGNSFSSWDAAGRTNLANFQDTIAKSIRAGQSLGMNATESVAMVFAALQAQGINTAALLSQVANIEGVNINQIQPLIDSGTFSDATAGFDAITASAKNAGGAVGGVAEKIRTLSDYASDLADVYSRAFEIRFDPQSTLDEITQGWRDMADGIEDAKNEIDDLQTSIGELTADKALKEYFLSVAEAYGDTIRAAQLRAEIAGIDSDLAQKNKDLSKAQDKNNKTLVGNSAAAAANRAKILDLVKSYQDHIRALAASGMSQEDLASTTLQLRQDFLTQAEALGYNSSELGVYASAFDDVSTAINGVPRDVTIDANTDPAMTALKEYEAKLREIGSTNYSGGTVTPPNFGAIARIRELEALIARYSSYAAVMAEQRSFAASDQALNAVRRYQEELLKIRGYATGGYTGAGGKYDVAGIVHRGEYVVPKEQVNQSTGTPYFMNQPRSFTQGGYAGGQATSMMVELSPTDRQLLARAGNVQLSIDGRVVANATNNANYVSALRGSN